ncbi:MAG: EpsI family protein [Candidatus Rokubacteria bacterium]|nr:EpsI family protein [Candidatus Rokubacteria bacterium]
MKRQVGAVVTVCVLVLVTGALARVPASVSERPLAEALTALPRVLGGWTATDEDVPACAMPRDRGAREHLLRTYRRAGQTVWMSVVYYPVQEHGLRLRAPELLLAANGSIELTAQWADVPVDDGARRSIPARLVLTRLAGCDAALLYWYKLGARAIASDHAYRAFLLVNRVLHGRSDGALVRVASPTPDASQIAAIVDAQKDFTRLLHAELLRMLPR